MARHTRVDAGNDHVIELQSLDAVHGGKTQTCCFPVFSDAPFDRQLSIYVFNAMPRMIPSFPEYVRFGY